MRNFVPALEESLMKFTPADIDRHQYEATYTAHGGWFGLEASPAVGKTPKRKKSKVKGARA